MVILTPISNPCKSSEDWLNSLHHFDFPDIPAALNKRLESPCCHLWVGVLGSGNGNACQYSFKDGVFGWFGLIGHGACFTGIALMEIMTNIEVITN